MALMLRHEDSITRSWLEPDLPIFALLIYRFLEELLEKQPRACSEVEAGLTTNRDIYTSLEKKVQLKISIVLIFSFKIY